MAKQTTVTVTDDLDGSANEKEVTFSLNGESWTIDLSAKNRCQVQSCPRRPSTIVAAAHGDAPTFG
jgi:hypothetical protein